MNRYQQYYKTIISYDLLLKDNYTNIFELPKLKKIIINATSKDFIQDKKNSIPVLLATELISGQKSQLTYAKKSIATFKLREGQVLGCKTSLRKNYMYSFLELFITILLPRLRDFKGISKNTVTKTGNFSLGLDNVIIFPQLENNFEIFEKLKGMNVNFIFKK